ncbi:TerD family protein [Rhodopseudomonas palustris]|uniref:TerD family protein n=1 Tax=Thiospirillum jenense TaxID=1653858 RepID=A0A839HCQ9_9GAMM|nr:TerD family protein [Thiospirillum jenense]MBB1091978.1 TerD family protein [Rhodopseudomonas palustris]MBB1126304.1 TerD family protein [Thiospirillum jenense]
MNLLRGQRVNLHDVIPTTQFSIGVAIHAPALTFDYACFGLNAQEQLTDDRYMTFYNQPVTPCGGVSLAASDQLTAPEQVRFLIDLNKLSPQITKLVLTTAIDGAGVMGDITSGQVHCWVNTQAVISFQFQAADFQAERAVMLIELYRKDAHWRIQALGQGFNGGLDALVQYFGGEVATAIDESIAPVTATGNEPTQSLPAGAAHSSPTTCARCQRTFHQDSGHFLQPHQYTRRCSQCDAEVRQLLNQLRQQFIADCQDDILTDAEWQRLHQSVQQARIEWSEFLYFIYDDILEFLERTLTIYAADGVITSDEEASFHQLCQQFNLPTRAIERLLERLAYLKKISDIRQGQLETVTTTLCLESDETCHLEIESAYQKMSARGIIPIAGKLLATNKKLHFLSLEGGWTMLWKNIMRIGQEPPHVVLELSTRQGNGYYRVNDAELTEAVLTTMTKIAKRQLLIPHEDDAVNRHIAQHIKIAVWQRDGGKCVQCGATSYLEFDHIIPFSKGGANTVDNLQLLCRRCNLAKGDRI